MILNRKIRNKIDLEKLSKLLSYLSSFIKENHHCNFRPGDEMCVHVAVSVYASYAVVRFKLVVPVADYAQTDAMSQHQLHELGHNGAVTSVFNRGEFREAITAKQISAINGVFQLNRKVNLTIGDRSPFPIKYPNRGNLAPQMQSQGDPSFWDRSEFGEGDVGPAHAPTRKTLIQNFELSLPCR